MQMWIAADYYGVAELPYAIFKRLMDVAASAPVDTLFEAYRILDTANMDGGWRFELCNQLAKHAARQRFNDVLSIVQDEVHREAFCNLHQDIFIEWVQSRYLRADHENSVAVAVRFWAHQNWPEFWQKDSKPQALSKYDYACSMAASGLLTHSSTWAFHGYALMKLPWFPQMNEINDVVVRAAYRDLGIYSEDMNPGSTRNYSMQHEATWSISLNQLQHAWDAPHLEASVNGPSIYAAGLEITPRFFFDGTFDGDFEVDKVRVGMAFECDWYEPFKFLVGELPVHWGAMKVNIKFGHGPWLQVDGEKGFVVGWDRCSTTTEWIIDDILDEVIEDFQEDFVSQYVQDGHLTVTVRIVDIR